MKNLLDHADFPCELLTSLPTRGLQMGEVSTLGWMIGLVKHAIWADSFIFYACCYFQFPKSQLHPSLPCDPLHRHVGLILIFLEDL
jgi:hypothetical protein